MFRAERQLVAHVKHWHTALCVVCEFRSTVLKQELVHIVHYVLCTVPRIRKSRRGADHIFMLIAAGMLFQRHRLRPRRVVSGTIIHEKPGSGVWTELRCTCHVTDQGILPFQRRPCCCVTLAQELVALAQLCAQPADAKGTHTPHR